MKHEVTITVFLDFYRMFETMLRETFLRRVEVYDIKGRVQWFSKSYLKDRKQKH